MRTDWENLRAGDVVITRSGQQLAIAQVITQYLPIDFCLNTKPCVIAASSEALHDGEPAMWYFLFPEGNYFANLQTAFSGKHDKQFGNTIDYYTGCAPSPNDAVGYFKGYVQQSLFA